jgi:predicted nucleotidyltransferase
MVYLLLLSPSLTIYGSVARTEETPESDLDLLLLIDGPVDFQLKQHIWNRFIQLN